MANDALAQSDAEALLKMEKVPALRDAFAFPDLGGRIEVPLISRDEREQFSLDVNRKRIALTTGYQARGRQVIVLARLDFAAPHRTRMAPKWACHTCTSIARATATDGPWRSRLGCSASQRMRGKCCMTS